MIVEIPADRLEALASRSLSKGAHRSFSDGVCAMEMVAYLAGESHSDHPACVCPVLAAYVRQLNDSMRDDATRDRWLKPILPRLIGTTATPDVAQQRAFALTDAALRVFTPCAFDTAVETLARDGLATEAESLAIHAATLRALPSYSAWSAAARSADAAAWSAAAWSAAARSAADAAWSADAARSAADAVWQVAIAALDQILPAAAPFGLAPVFGDEYLTEKAPVDPRDQPEDQEASQ